MHFKDMNGNPSVFDLSVRTLNRNSKTGGRLTEYKGVSLTHNLPSKNKHKTVSLKSIQSVAKKNKNPNHIKNRTRNIQLPNGKGIQTIHFRLIDTFNDKKMHY